MANNPKILREGFRRFVPIAKATVIVIGDLIGLASGLAVPFDPASSAFVGVAEDNSTDQDEVKIRVLCEMTEKRQAVVSAQYLYGARLERDSLNTLKADIGGVVVAVVTETDTGAGSTEAQVEFLKSVSFQEA